MLLHRGPASHQQNEQVNIPIIITVIRALFQQMCWKITLMREGEVHTSFPNLFWFFTLPPTLEFLSSEIRSYLLEFVASML